MLPNRNPATGCFESGAVLTVPERFWPKVDTGSEDGCWPWTGSIFKELGYGAFRYEGQAQYAHRVAWILASGQPIPTGLRILHTCDNRPCVRNDDPGIYAVRGIEYPRFGHLWLGTQAANIADMVDKGRLSHGDRHPFAKLTADDVREIRRRYIFRKLTSVDLAQEYEVARTIIMRIIRRERWAHIE